MKRNEKIEKKKVKVEQFILKMYTSKNWKEEKIDIENAKYNLLICKSLKSRWSVEWKKMTYFAELVGNLKQWNKNEKAKRIQKILFMGILFTYENYF